MADDLRKEIRLLVMDVDGTLTDGGIYIGDSGEAMKRFDVKDGYGIRNILPKHKILPAIITGRSSEILQNRCNELEITELIQGSKDKVCALKGMLNKLHIDFNEVAYIGDDLNDLEVMKQVRICGCPSDAVNSVKEISDYVTNALAGHGAVREFIDWLVEEVC